MAPNQAELRDVDLEDQERRVSDNDLVENAGKITIDEAQMWGRGILNDIKRTVGSHWLVVSLWLCREIICRANKLNSPS